VSYGGVDTKSLLDIALEGQSEEYRRKVLELAFKGKIEPTDPIFLILLATGRLEVLIRESPKPEDFELAFTRWMGRINKTLANYERVAMEKQEGQIASAVNSLVRQTELRFVTKILKAQLFYTFILSIVIVLALSTIVQARNRVRSPRSNDINPPSVPIPNTSDQSIMGNRDDAVANGRMNTSFTLTNNGRLTAVTNTRTGVRLKGFTGAVAIVLLDGNKRPIWASNTQSYGVDGCTIGRCNRNDNWSATVPADIMGRVKGYAIIQQHNPTWLRRLGARGDQFIGWLGSDEGKATVKTIVAIAAML
jgi:hypothetical protein